MNAPYFDTKNLTAPFESSTWCHQMLDEQHRCCDGIDARLQTVLNDSIQINKQLSEMEKEMKTTNGFFARWSLRTKIKKLQDRLQWHHRVLNKLYEARIDRTPTW